MKSVNDQPSGNLPFLKPDDIQYFDKLLVKEISVILLELPWFLLIMWQCPFICLELFVG